MTVELYRIIAIVCFSIAGLMLIASIILFFWYKIPKVVGDLTGSTERKAVESIRRHNESGQQRSERTNHAPIVTDEITEKIVRNDQNETTLLAETAASAETTLLSDNNDLKETNKNDSFVMEEEITLLHSNDVIK